MFRHIYMLLCLHTYVYEEVLPQTYVQLFHIRMSQRQTNMYMYAYVYIYTQLYAAYVYSLCVCVCVYIYIYACAYMHTYLYVYKRTYTHTHKHAQMAALGVFFANAMGQFQDIWHNYVCVYIYMHVRTCIRTYTYINAHTHIHKHAQMAALGVFFANAMGQFPDIWYNFCALAFGRRFRRHYGDEEVCACVHVCVDKL